MFCMAISRLVVLHSEPDSRRVLFSYLFNDHKHGTDTKQCMWVSKLQFIGFFSRRRTRNGWTIACGASTIDTFNDRMGGGRGGCSTTEASLSKRKLFFPESRSKGPSHPPLTSYLRGTNNSYGFSSVGDRGQYICCPHS